MYFGQFGHGKIVLDGKQQNGGKVLRAGRGSKWEVFEVGNRRWEALEVGSRRWEVGSFRPCKCRDNNKFTFSNY
ncbi:MAG: hypothetical protein DA408_20045 [Bacteroidetes bacterium]|nr:MAG: hypothetical protein C7N36_21360 [Bacteroidota bacterium]PTM08725.1 MAG: hypothetical protein DA408_20045 [Bacteroidota bacterium]